MTTTEHFPTHTTGLPPAVSSPLGDLEAPQPADVIAAGPIRPRRIR
jgi:hypothetical protein